MRRKNKLAYLVILPMLAMIVTVCIILPSRANEDPNDKVLSNEESSVKIEEVKRDLLEAREAARTKREMEVFGAVTDNFAEFVQKIAALDAASENEEPISIRFREAPVEEALASLAQQAEFSYAIEGEIPKDAKVTLSLHQAKPRAAFQMVCRAANLSCDYDYANRIFLVSVEPMATVGGVQVPVVAWGGANLNRPLFGRPYGEDSMIRMKMQMAGIPGEPFEEDGRLVDLEAKDESLQEALLHLAEQAGVILEFGPGVSPDLRVSAKIHNVMFDEALFYLTSQANLTYAVVGKEDGKTKIRVYSMPVLEAKITGVKEQPKCPACGSVIGGPDWNYCCRCGAPLTGGTGGTTGATRSGGGMGRSMPKP